MEVSGHLYASLYTKCSAPELG